MKRRALILGLVCAASLARAAAQIEFDPAAGQAFPALAIPVGVRATGMGDAATAFGGDVYSLARNPAGLSGVEGFELGLAHNEWASSLGLKQELLFYGQGLGRGSALALSLNYVALGSLERRASSGALEGSLAASFAALSLGYARPLLGGMTWGAALEAMNLSLYDAGLTSFGGSLGLLWQGSRFRGGLSLNHLGAGLQGFQAPASLNAGAAAMFMHDSLALGLDAELPFSATPLLKAGLEYSAGSLALRAGWRQPLGGAESVAQAGPTAGAGFRAGLLRLDYSFAPSGELSTAHRLQATLDLPANFFRARLVSGPEVSSATAQAMYEEASGMERQGEVLKALIQYQRAVEAYPPALKASPQPFYTASLKKVEELQARLSKGGDQGQIQKLSKESLVSADKELKAGRYKEAITLLKQAALIDPGNPAISRMLEEARGALNARLATFRDAAHFGESGKDLAMAVENYRKLLALAPGDSEAQEYMNRHRAEIKELLAGYDRKGIYFYVAGKLEEALKAWSDGEALDYFGDLDFKRNIDKARRRLELMGGAK